MKPETKIRKIKKIVDNLPTISAVWTFNNEKYVKLSSQQFFLAEIEKIREVLKNGKR